MDVALVGVRMAASLPGRLETMAAPAASQSLPLAGDRENARRNREVSQ